MPDDRNIPGLDCEAVRPLLPAYARGDLEPLREDGLLGHVAGCPACRVAMAEADPASLFGELRGRSLPEEFWQGFDQTLRARLAEEKQAGWRWSLAWGALGTVLRPPRLAYFAAPLAMVFLLGVTLYVTRPGRFVPGPRTNRSEDGVRSPYSPPPTASRRGVVGPRADHRVTAALPAVAPFELAARLAAEPPPLEEVSSPAARIYRLDVAGQDPTPIYLVVDETIDF